MFISPSHVDPDSCGNSGIVHIGADANKKVYSTVLTAFTAGKNIQLYLGGCISESGVTAE